MSWVREKQQLGSEEPAYIKTEETAFCEGYYTRFTSSSGELKETKGFI